MTPNQISTAKRARFSTPANGAEKALVDGESVDWPRPWTKPSPLIVQRRAQAVERAIALEAVLRILILFVADCLILFVAHEFVDLLRSVDGIVDGAAPLLNGIFPRGTYHLSEVLSAVVVGLAIFGNYRGGSRWHNASTLLAGSSLGLSLVFWNTLWNGVQLEAVLGFIALLGATGFALSIGRHALYKLVQGVRPQPLVVSRVLILGSLERVEQLKESEAIRGDRRLSIVGHITTNWQIDHASLGGLSDLVWIIERHDIDTLILAESLEADALADVLEVAERTGCATLSGTPIFPLGGFVPEVIHRGHTPFVAIRRPSLRVPQLVSKRVFDIVFASLLLVVLSPVFAIIALVIRLASKGPVFYSNLRVGYGGEGFMMYKFRSMVENAHDLRDSLQAQSVYPDARVFKIPNDPRITRVGRFLRRSSLDELPQLWNVLRGEMSLVGPRPPLASEVELYEEHNYTRFDMKPGITGPWQVSGRNTVRSFDEIVAIETHYLTEWSLLKDFAILLKTVPAVLSMRGAV